MTKMMLAATLHQILKLLLLLPLLPVEASPTLLLMTLERQKRLFRFRSLFTRSADANLELCQSPLAVAKNVLLCQLWRGLPF